MTEQLLAFGFVLVSAVLLAIYGIRYRGRAPQHREISVFQALSDEVGRVAEQGKVIHVALGKGSLLGNESMVSVAALQGLRALMDLAAAYDTPPLITTADPTLYLLASDYMRRAYDRIGNVSSYKPEFVQFTAHSPTTYAAMAATHLYQGAVGSNIMLGAFDQEISLLAEAAERKNVPSVGGTTSLVGVGVFYPLLDAHNLVIGEEFFAGVATVRQESTYTASLWTQDALRWLVAATVIASAVLSVFGGGG